MHSLSLQTSRGMFPPRPWGASLLASPIFWRLQVFLGLWLHPSSLFLCLHLAFSVCLLLLSLSKTFFTGSSPTLIIQDGSSQNLELNHTYIDSLF